MVAVAAKSVMQTTVMAMAVEPEMQTVAMTEQEDPVAAAMAMPAPPAIPVRPAAAMAPVCLLHQPVTGKVILHRRLCDGTEGCRNCRVRQGCERGE